MRQTTFEFVLSFGRFAPPDTFVEYRNIRDIDFFSSERSDVFDVVFITYDVLGLRSTPQWEWILLILSRLRDSAGTLVALPQDDYTRNEVMDEGLYSVGVDVVYSSVENGLEILYPTMSREREIRHALTGYVDEAVAAEHMRSWLPHAERSVDLGTRVTMLAPWLGRLGQRKGLFAKQIAERLSDSGLRIDISARDEDVFLGDDWHAFLGSCRTTVGQKGGASLCDPTGDIAAAVTEYLAAYPEAEFEDVEAACFPGLDGRAEMTAISPRLFDAAMLGTAQILIEDDYLGVLEPWTHYIPTDCELSNLDDIAEVLANPARTEAIARAAAEVLITSGDFSYRSFVSSAIDECTTDSAGSSRTIHSSRWQVLLWKVTPELFESIQHLGYLGRLFDAGAELESLVQRVEGLAQLHPDVAPHLTLGLLKELGGWVPLVAGLEVLADPIVDVLRECALAGVLPDVGDLWRLSADLSVSEWTAQGWVGRDQAELMILKPT